MRSGSSARRRRARASQRASGARALRTHKAAGRAAAGGRSAGERAALQPSPRPRHRSSSNSDAGTGAGPQGTCPRNPAPQLGVVGSSPRPPRGWQGQEPGGISTRPSRRGGRVGQERPPLSCGYAPPPPTLPEPGLLLGALCSRSLPQCSGHSLWERGLRGPGSP